MIVINTFKDIASFSVQHIRMIDARKHEVLKVQKMFPFIDVWSCPYDMYKANLSSDALIRDTAGTLTLFPAKLHQYPVLMGRHEAVCLDYIGGGLVCS